MYTNDPLNLNRIAAVLRESDEIYFATDRSVDAFLHLHEDSSGRRWLTPSLLRRSVLSDMFLFRRPPCMEEEPSNINYHGF